MELIITSPHGPISRVTSCPSSLQWFSIMYCMSLLLPVDLVVVLLTRLIIPATGDHSCPSCHRRISDQKGSQSTNSALIRISTPRTSFDLLLCMSTSAMKIILACPCYSLVSVWALPIYYRIFTVGCAFIDFTLRPLPRTKPRRRNTLEINYRDWRWKVRCDTGKNIIVWTVMEILVSNLLGMDIYFQKTRRDSAIMNG